jgi:A/G-specific adenine glycosylase
MAGWFQRQSRILPWRENPDTYRVWISEIMLQQTQVVTVIPYFEKFVARFPDVKSLATAPVEDVLLHWAGLGYYSRARNLHRGAQMIYSSGKARFPKDREGWLEIPGVGDYTAGAILSISLNQPEAILDGNVERVISRLRRVSRAGNLTHYKERLWRLSRIFVERANSLGIEPRVTNQALMELGATVCSPKKPKCLLCPLVELCRAHQASEEERFPTKKKPKEWLEVKEEVHCFIDREGRVLLRQRNKGEWRAGLWDLLGEQPQDFKSIYIGEVKSKHIVTRHKISRLTKIWRVEKASKKLLTAAEPSFQLRQSELRWISPENPGVALGSALKKTLSQVRETFPEAWPASSTLRVASSD